MSVNLILWFHECLQCALRLHSLNSSGKSKVQLTWRDVCECAVCTYLCRSSWVSSNTVQSRSDCTVFGFINHKKNLTRFALHLDRPILCSLNEQIVEKCFWNCFLPPPKSILQWSCSHFVSRGAEHLNKLLTNFDEHFLRGVDVWLATADSILVVMWSRDNSTNFLGSGMSYYSRKLFDF